jgi:hypothetical protein
VLLLEWLVGKNYKEHGESIVLIFKNSIASVLSLRRVLTQYASPFMSPSSPVLSCLVLSCLVLSPPLSSILFNSLLADTILRLKPGPLWHRWLLGISVMIPSLPWPPLILLLLLTPPLSTMFVFKKQYAWCALGV